MKSKQSIIIAFMTLSALLPFGVYAESVVDEIGDGVSNVASKVGDVADDTAITSKVKAKLTLESDIPLNISVTTTNNVVYLSGIVDTRLQANKIIQLAESVDGVKDVNDSKLQITSSDSFFSDATITAKAMGKIMQLRESDKIGSGSDLHVETTNGDVHVYGSVTQNDDKQVVKDAVGSINGVKTVSANIDVVNK